MFVRKQIPPVPTGPCLGIAAAILQPQTICSRVVRGCVTVQSSPAISKIRWRLLRFYARLNLKRIVTTVTACRIGRIRFLELGSGHEEVLKEREGEGENLKRQTKRLPLHEPAQPRV